MTPEDWQKVRAILESALELDSAQRPLYLDRECSDPSLRRELESLIAAHEQADTGLMNSPPAARFADQEEARFRLLPGKRIGPYEILAEIALGGMGAVYRAVRADGQYKQQVALKMVRVDLGAEVTTARFRNERQVLATLDHANIAKILDGGTTADGIPYFVMEFIDGLPITDFCDQHKLTIDERLKIFRTVCSAVHYAHQRLVIHRDIKPTNVLITSEGVPKLLDFGIAKILDPNLLPESATLTAGQWLMTPEYASPEQLRGEPITTSTDVYSLGLVLYELLAGRSAYRFSSHMPHEIARAVLETDPEKPSTAIRRNEDDGEDAGERAPLAPEQLGALRGDSPEKLCRRLAGDLDNIVLKAVRKEPRERYNSADQLSEDIRRHLEGLPVLARKSTLAYRGRKYVLRHKVGVTAAALVSLSLLAGLVLTFREARIARANQLRAERRFNDVRQLANSLMFDIHDSIQDLPGSTAARKLLVEKALQYLDSLAKESGGDPSLQRELATAYERVGDVQGNPYYANLGDLTGASTSYQKSLDIRLEVSKVKPDDLDVQRALSSNYARIASLRYVNGDLAGSEETYRKCLAIDEKIVALSNAPADRINLEVAHGNLGFALAARGDLNTARAEYAKALGILQGFRPGEVPRDKLDFGVAGISERLADVLILMGDRTQALSFASSALKIRKDLSTADPTNAARRQQLAVGHLSLGDLLAETVDKRNALGNYQKGLEISRSLSSADPTNVQASRIMADAYNKVGRVLTVTGNPTRALQNHQQALEIFNTLSKTDSGDEMVVTGMADSFAGFGLAHMALAERADSSKAIQMLHWTEARKWFHRALDEWSKVPEANQGVNQIGSFTPEPVKQNLKKCDLALAGHRSPLN